MTICGVNASSSVGSSSSVRPNRESLEQFLQDALKSGKIDQKQYDDTVKALKDLNTQLNGGTSSTNSGGTNSVRDQVNTILQKVGLQLPQGKGGHHHHRRADNGTPAGTSSPIDVLKMMVRAPASSSASSTPSGDPDGDGDSDKGTAVYG